jgi:hypothetical protein
MDDTTRKELGKIQDYLQVPLKKLESLACGPEIADDVERFAMMIADIICDIEEITE